MRVETSPEGLAGFVKPGFGPLRIGRGTRILDAVRDAFFPARCLVCENFFHPERHTAPSERIPGIPSYFAWLLGGVICPSCRDGFLPVVSPLCNLCGVPFITPEGEDHLCEACITAPKSFRMARACGLYDQTLMTLIHRFKYAGRLQLARPLGMLLRCTYDLFWGNEEVDVVIPVPLHSQRFRRRGFNQSYLLVKDWPQAGGRVPLIEKELLVRGRRTDPQTGLDRKHRIQNIRNAFFVRDPTQVEGRRILLVDDVYTTGATVDECARTLLESGAYRVDVLTLARAR